MNKLKKIFLTVVIIALFVLTGCFNRQTPEEKIYEILENVVKLEEVFEDQQKPLLDLENEEKALYDQIISLGMKEYDKIVELSNKAIEIVDKRKELMEKENNSILSAKEAFVKIEPIISEIEDDKTKKLGEKLYDTMMKRYEAHEQLFEKYMEGLSNDRKLYEMLKNKEMSMKELQDQIEKINKTYEEVIEVNQLFNDSTNQYNQEKMEFYKQSKLDVEFEK